MRKLSYREMRQLTTFDDRFEYLSLRGIVGDSTFGSDRYFNQRFYRSHEWKSARREAIVRDGGCDLGVEGFEIHGRILIHHLNPITIEDIREGNSCLFDLDNLITTTHDTHNAIHYGDIDLIPREFVERKPGDTKLW